jgi:hypothetical protein
MADTENPKQLIIDKMTELGLKGEDLDDLVHDCKSEEAAAINNGGQDEQIDYLLASGMLVKDVLEKLVEVEKDKNWGT